jgi:hypothetical protein
VKVGGAWGGLRNLAGAMVEVVTGLRELVAEAAGLKGRIWFKMEPSRGEARKGARMTRHRMEKRAAEARRMRVFGRARVTDGRDGLL